MACDTGSNSFKTLNQIDLEATATHEPVPFCGIYRDLRQVNKAGIREPRRVHAVLLKLLLKKRLPGEFRRERSTDNSLMMNQRNRESYDGNDDPPNGLHTSPPSMPRGYQRRTDMTRGFAAPGEPPYPPGTTL